MAAAGVQITSQHHTELTKGQLPSMMQPLNRIQAGELLIELRKRQGLSQTEIAMKLGYVNVNFISMIERGKSRVPVERFADVAEAYGASPEEALVMFRGLWPELWKTVSYLDQVSDNLFRKCTFEEAHDICRRSVDTSLFSSSACL